MTRHDRKNDDSQFDGAWLEDTAARAATAVRMRVQDAPYLTLGAAIGLGLIVGGGLWKPVARSLVGLGARIALATVVPAMIDRINPSDRRPDHQPSSHQQFNHQET